MTHFDSNAPPGGRQARDHVPNVPRLSARDLWCLRSLLVGNSLNGEVDTASEAIQPLLIHLNKLGMEKRQDAFDGYLCSRPDGALLLDALEEANPTGPIPDEDAEDDPEQRRIKLTRASEVTTREIEWEWMPRVPLGMLSLFAGDPKLGKSLVTIGLAAATSLGSRKPGSDHETPAGSVIILSAEDDPARTIVPRLKAAEADLEKIHLLEAVYLSDGLEALPNLIADIDAIEAAIEAAGDCRLVVVDPVSAYLGGTDDHKNSELRGLLSPLKALAERRNVAVVLVTHLTKSSGSNAKHRVMGSIAYVGACRANFLFVKDRDDPTGRRVFMVCAGGNLVEDPPTLAYRIEDHGDGPVVCWEEGTVAITAEAALLAEAIPQDEDAKADRTACEEWLGAILADGRVLQSEIVSMGKTAGFNLSALNRAKTRIGATTERDGFGKGSCCYWVVTPP